VKIYVAAVEALRKKGKKLSLPPKLVEKLVWVPVISYCEISFPVRHLMAYYTGNWPFSPPNRLTLGITSISTFLLPSCFVCVSEYASWG
jgi:hypothetical protein